MPDEVRQPQPAEQLAVGAEILDQQVGLIRGGREEPAEPLSPVVALIGQKLERVAGHDVIDLQIAQETDRHDQHRQQRQHALSDAARFESVRPFEEQRHDEQQAERARKRGVRAEHARNREPFLSHAVQRQQAHQQIERLAHRRDEEEPAGQQPQERHGAKRRFMRKIEP